MMTKTPPILMNPVMNRSMKSVTGCVTNRFGSFA